MRFAVSIPPFTDATTLVDLAVDAETAGWDAVLLWDHLQFVMAMELDIHDPFTVLGAMAVRTERVRLGTCVTPLARRRPWIVAKQLVTLDHLSGGRAMLGVGLGEPPDADFECFGDPGDPRERAVRLDDGLELLVALLSGEAVDHTGPRYRVQAQLRPAPVQRPRPPIFVAAVAPNRRPLRRAVRHDGVFPIGDPDLMSPAQVGEYLAGVGSPPDWDVFATLTPGFPVADFEAVGVTWLVEGAWPVGDWLAELRDRIRSGPPPV
jgi:alkanesulfonate monooxygenase SsuD/methylene tetrahydromethanopterin reductase-like flavin-dependent oxidoreductase (luciferase family)